MQRRRRKVAVHFLDGEVLQGYCDTPLDALVLRISPAPGGNTGPTIVNLASVKKVQVLKDWLPAPAPSPTPDAPSEDGAP